MGKKTINEVLAENLAYYMAASPFKTQKALGEKCGIAQRTIGNYLNPALRLEGSKGKSPSANLGQLDKLAEALGVEVWELLRPMSSEDRVVYRKIEEAFREVGLLKPQSTPAALQLHEPVKRYRAG